MDGDDEKGLEMLEGGEASSDPANTNTREKAKGRGKTRAQYDSSLPFAIQRTFFFHFWLSGLLYAIGGTSIRPSTHHGI